ncbi:Manganese transport system membrane protein MntB, partial [Haemophilus influenzae]
FLIFTKIWLINS